MSNKNEDEFNRRDTLFFFVIIVSLIMSIWVTSLLMNLIWAEAPFIIRFFVFVMVIIFVFSGLVEFTERTK